MNAPFNKRTLNDGRDFDLDGRGRADWSLYVGGIRMIVAIVSTALVALIGFVLEV